MTSVITGAGLVSSLGTDVEESFAAYCRGESALHPLRVFRSDRYRITSAYEMPDLPPGGPDVPGRASRWLREAVSQALGQAGLADPARRGDQRIPVIVGTGLGEQRSLELWGTDGADVTLDQLHFGPAVAGLGLGRPVTLVNACSASLYALAVAEDLLALGEADAVVVAGSDAICESMFGLLDRVNMRPPTEVRPFDAERVGVILGEGAAAIVLETPAAARLRSAVPLAGLRTVATTCDAHHVTAPDRAGVGRAFREAHQRAGVGPAEIDLIMAHGTGTILNDATEALALRDAFGEATGHPLVTALKSQIGHTSGASGLMSLVVAVKAMETGTVPPTLNHVTPTPEAVGLRLVTGAAERADIRISQVNASGFGGVNAVAVLDRASGDADPEPAAPVRRDASRGVVVTGVGLQIPGLAPGPDPLAVVRDGRPVARTGTPPDFDGQEILGRRGLRYKDRATRLALCAVAHALRDAGLSAPAPGSPESASFGVVVASTSPIADTVRRVVSEIHAGGVPVTSPMDLPNVSGNVAASSIAIWFGLTGHNLTVSAGPTSGLDAVYLATTAIRTGRVDRVVVVGVEPGDETVASLVAAAHGRHDAGTSVPAVFDGAVAVVLEAESAARGRHAQVLAEVGGYAERDRMTDSVQAAGKADDGSSPDLWLVPCQHHSAVAAQVAEPSAAVPDERIDVSAVSGEAAGAYGVLQTAVAAAWLTGRAAGRALLTSGGCWGGGYASLTLRSAR